MSSHFEFSLKNKNLKQIKEELEKEKAKLEKEIETLTWGYHDDEEDESEEEAQEWVKKYNKKINEIEKINKNIKKIKEEKQNEIKNEIEMIKKNQKEDKEIENKKYYNHNKNKIIEEEADDDEEEEEENEFSYGETISRLINNEIKENDNNIDNYLEMNKKLEEIEDLKLKLKNMNKQKTRTIYDKEKENDPIIKRGKTWLNKLERGSGYGKKHIRTKEEQEEIENNKYKLLGKKTKNENLDIEKPKKNKKIINDKENNNKINYFIKFIMALVVLFKIKYITDPLSLFKVLWMIKKDEEEIKQKYKKIYNKLKEENETLKKENIKPEEKPKEEQEEIKDNNIIINFTNKYGKNNFELKNLNETNLFGKLKNDPEKYIKINEKYFNDEEYEELDDYSFSLAESEEWWRERLQSFFEFLNIDSILDNDNKYFEGCFASILIKETLKDDRKLNHLNKKNTLKWLQKFYVINENINIDKKSDEQIEKIYDKLLGEKTYNTKKDEIIYYAKKEKYLIQEDWEKVEELDQKNEIIIKENNNDIYNYKNWDPEIIDKIKVTKGEELDQAKKLEEEWEEEAKNDKNMAKLKPNEKPANGEFFGFVIYMDQKKYKNDPELDKKIHIPDCKKLMAYAAIKYFGITFGYETILDYIIVNHEHGKTKHKCHIQGMIKIFKRQRSGLKRGAIDIGENRYIIMFQEGKTQKALREYVMKYDELAYPGEKALELKFSGKDSIKKVLENEVNGSDIEELEKIDEEKEFNEFMDEIYKEPHSKADLIKIAQETKCVKIKMYITQFGDKILKFNEGFEEIANEEIEDRWRWNFPQYMLDLIEKHDKEINEKPKEPDEQWPNKTRWDENDINDRLRYNIFKILRDWFNTYCKNNNRNDFSTGSRKQALVIYGERGVGKTYFVNHLIQDPNNIQDEPLKNPYIVYCKSTLNWAEFKRKEKTAQLVVLDDVYWVDDKQKETIKYLMVGGATVIKSNYIDNERWMYNCPCIVLTNNKGLYQNTYTHDEFKKACWTIGTDIYIGAPGSDADYCLKEVKYQTPGVEGIMRKYNQEREERKAKMPFITYRKNNFFS